MPMAQQMQMARLSTWRKLCPMGMALGPTYTRGGPSLGGTAGEAAAAAAQLEVNVEELLCDLRARREYVLEYHALLTSCCLRPVSPKRPLCAMLCMGRWSAAVVLALLR